MSTPLVNVTRVERLKSFPILCECVLLDPAGAAKAELSAYRGLQADGDYPAALTDVPRGIIQYFSETEADDVYATVLTEGIGILEVEPGEVITVDSQVAINSDGKAVAAASGNQVLGYARNASSGSTVSVPHYIEVKVANQVAA